MANIFTWDWQDIDLKDCIKVKTNCQQNDTMVLQFKIYDYDNPVDLTNYNVTFVAKKPDNTIYGQAESITKSSNSLTITCDSQLTSDTGRVVGVVVITDNNGNRKGSYFIVFNVFGILNDEDRVVSKNFVDVLDRFDEDVAIALSLSEEFKNDIETAQAIAEDFATKIPQATNIDEQLNNTINIGNTLESKLTNDITIGTSLNTKLETNLTMADTVKSELVLATATANINKDALITTIGKADVKLQDFKNYDTTEIVPKTNLMLNEMYCNKELLSINHGLDGYPVAKMTYTEFGTGVGGAGDFPSGADSDCNLMQNKAIYTDNNNMTIFVPQNYYIALPSINKINDYKYVVTFTNSTRSILIELIEGSTSEDIKLINDSLTNINSSISDLTYPTATGTSTALIVPMKTLINGYAKTFIASANNNGSATTINGKHLYKPNTTISPTLITGKAYTVWYSSIGDCFFIKASAEGDAITDNVLATKKFSNDNDTGLIGTMPNNGAVIPLLNAGESYPISLGYHNGNGIVSAKSLASQTVATATSDKVLNGYTFWVNGVKNTGNIPSKTAQTYAPSTTQQIINAGQYISEPQTIAPVTGDATINDVISGKIFSSSNGINLVGNATIESLGGKYYASGTVTGSVSLSFTPKLVILNVSGRLIVLLTNSFGLGIEIGMWDIRSTADKSAMGMYNYIDHQPPGYIDGYVVGNIIYASGTYYAFG